MQVPCEACGRIHEIPDEKVPFFGARLRCAGCGQLLELPAKDEAIMFRTNSLNRRIEPHDAPIASGAVAVLDASPSELNEPAPSNEPQREDVPVSMHGDEETDVGLDTEAEPSQGTVTEVTGETDPPAGTPPASGDDVPARDGEDLPHREAKAARLARMVVTDIAYADPDRFAESQAAGSVLRDFAKEIERAHSFYRKTVGEEIADSTPYFRNAILEILAQNPSVDA